VQLPRRRRRDHHAARVVQRLRRRRLRHLLLRHHRRRRRLARQVDLDRVQLGNVRTNLNRQISCERRSSRKGKKDNFDARKNSACLKIYSAMSFFIQELCLDYIYFKSAEIEESPESNQFLA